MGRMDSRVVVVSGAARGQGRAHAVALAEAGASIVAFDICEPLQSPLHPSSTKEDLDETVRLVEAQGSRCLAAQVDARSLPDLLSLAESVMKEFGRVDSLVINHGIWAVAENSWVLTEEDWQESIDVLLTGAWKVSTAFIPKILEGERGGSIVLTSSVMGTRGQPGSAAYTVAKHGVLGLMRTLAWELGPSSVRVNAIMPGVVDTQMNTGGSVERSVEWYPRYFELDRSLLPMPVIDPAAIARAAVFLVSDDSAPITGVALPVDAGWSNF